MRGPSLFKTFAVVGVTMAMTTACLAGGGNSGSGGGGGGSPTGQASGSTVTIWTSMDQPVIDGLKAGLAPLAQQRASR